MDVLRVMLIWLGVAAVVILGHLLIFGETMDNSSFFGGLLVASVAILLEDR